MTIHNERYLNAEDDTVVGPLEIATDLTLLHPKVKIGYCGEVRSIIRSTKANACFRRGLT